MIEVKGLVKSFDGFRALDGLTLTAPKGAVYGLVGPNGAGKSTLIRHLAGIYRQDAGELLVDGEPVFENPAVKARIAYIPDDIFYYTQASIRDMARFAQSLYPRFDKERYEKLKELFTLDEKRPMRKLSKGQQKQAAFQIAMAQRPDYVILDEPISTEQYAVGFLKGNTELRDAVNAELLKMAEDGTMLSIAEKYVDQGLVIDSLCLIQ